MSIFLRNLLWLALGLVLSLIFLDVYIQAAEIQTTMETTIDSQVGPAYFKGKRVTRFNEGFYIGGVNKYGYFGPALAPVAEEGERRILMLGDSYVMGITVFERDHFCTLLGRGLAEAGIPGAQVLNFGRADFNFWNMYQYYHDFASRWDHELVVFMVEYSDLVPSGQVEKDLYPVCVVRNDSLVVDYSFRNSERFSTYQRIEPIAANSAVFRMAFNAKKMVIRGELKEVLFGKLAPVKKIGPRKPLAARTWPTTKTPEITLRILDILSHDPGVIFVVKGPLPEEIWQDLQGTGRPVWDVEAVLEEMEAAGIDPFYWDVTGKRGHWNHEAHRRIADYLQKKILEMPGWRPAS